MKLDRQQLDATLSALRAASEVLHANEDDKTQPMSVRAMCGAEAAYTDQAIHVVLAERKRVEKAAMRAARNAMADINTGTLR